MMNGITSGTTVFLDEKKVKEVVKKNKNEVLNELSNYSLKSEIPTKVSQLTNDSEYVNSSRLNHVVEVAEGKTNTYVVSANAFNMFGSTEDSIELRVDDFYAYQISDISGNFIDSTKLKLGDIFYITELNIPDRWVSYKDENLIYLDKMETSKVDLSNYVNLSDKQTINGNKDFVDGIAINGLKVLKDSNNRIVFYYGDTPKVKIGNADTLFTNRVTPDSSNTYDLGRSGVYWKDLYLSGKIKDGTNEKSLTELLAERGTVKITDLSELDSYKTPGVYYFKLTKILSGIETINLIELIVNQELRVSGTSSSYSIVQYYKTMATEEKKKRENPQGLDETGWTEWESY